LQSLTKNDIMVNKLQTKYETKYEVMAEQLKNLCKTQEELKDNLEKYITEDRAWKDAFIEKLDKKYAGKYIEVISIGALIAIITQIISSAL